MTYDVTVARIGYSFITVTVDADDKAEAESIALEEAENNGYWDECDAQFEIDSCVPTE